VCIVHEELNGLALSALGVRSGKLSNVGRSSDGGPTICYLEFLWQRHLRVPGDAAPAVGHRRAAFLHGGIVGEGEVWNLTSPRHHHHGHRAGTHIVPK
jgi:hypothetical protein